MNDNVKEETAVKPVVAFLGPVKVVRTFGGGRCAIINDVIGHPILGHQRQVQTSLVVEVDNEDNPTLIETRNTIYKRAYLS